MTSATAHQPAILTPVPPQELVRRQLLWIATGIVLVSGVLIVLALYHQRALRLDAGRALTVSFAQVIEEQTSRTLQTVDQRLQLAIGGLSQLEIARNLTQQSARTMLGEQIKALPYVRAMWVLDAKGRLVFDSDLGNIGINLDDRAYFQIYRTDPTTTFYVGVPVRSRSTGTWLISASRPWRGRDGSFKGVIVAAVDPPYFDKLWQAVDVGPGGSVALLKRDGVLMMRSPFQDDVMGKNLQSGVFFREQLPKGPDGNFQALSPIDGKLRQYAYRTVAVRPELVVMVGQAVDRILAPWRQLAWLALGVWAAGSAGILFLSVLLRRVWQRQFRTEEMQRQVFERITDAFVALDRNWVYTYVNQKAGEMFRRDPAQLVGKHIWTEFPEGLGQKFHLAYEQAMADQNPVLLEEYYPPYDRWFENRVYPSPEGLTVYFQDITERKRTQEKLRLSEESLAITLQSIGDAVIASDVQGRITRMNAMAERLTGWRLDEALGRPLAEVFRIFNSRTREPALDPVRQVIEKGGLMVPSNQTGLYSRDGQEFQISNIGAPIRDQGGQIAGVVVVFSDVTEKYRTQAALQESEASLAAAQALAHLGSWTLDLQRLRGTWSAEEYRLHYRDPLLGAPSFEGFLALIHRDDVERVKAFQVGFGKMEGPVTIDYRTHPALGPVRHLSAAAHIVLDDRGNALRMEGSTLDVTERKQAEALIRASEETLRESAQHTQTILDNLFDGVITIDDRGIVESFNKGASAIFGYVPDEVLGHNVSMLMPEPHRSSHDGFMQHHRQTGTGNVIGKTRELEAVRKDGRVFPISLSVSKIARGDKAVFVGIVRDLTQQHQDIEEIRHLAFYDSLTSLPNRRLLLDRLGQAMVTSARSGQNGALMFLDLDHFKQLNDSLGHDVGDVLLQQVASRLQACVREGDSVARLGGDEFVVLLEALSPHNREAASQAEVIADKILAAFRQAFILRGHSFDSTPSIGIVVFMGHNESKEELLKRADVAMYQAKAAGRNNAQFFDPAMQAAVEARDALEKELRRGLAEREFVLHFQIQVDGNNRPIGAEALARWNHATRGLVSPAHFIPLAEETGLILPLGQWVLESACAQLVQWSRLPATAHWTLAVNVSASQLAQAGFVANVMAALQAAGANPRLLKLELTESMLVGDVEVVIMKMNELKSHGVGFSLDDFGTGYSSLSYLNRLPLSQLKIDQSFVRDILSDPNDAVIVRTIVALGHSLGLSVIAEGVETAAQRAFLGEIGCDAFQGYYFGRPGTADTLISALVK